MWRRRLRPRLLACLLAMAAAGGTLDLECSRLNYDNDAGSIAFALSDAGFPFVHTSHQLTGADSVSAAAVAPPLAPPVSSGAVVPARCAPASTGCPASGCGERAPASGRRLQGHRGHEPSQHSPINACSHSFKVY